ncbi:Transcription factor ILR3 [Hirschfeldia incana]|nr:Transcription factor ILR3 [Hirschfeldia incana]KAJ0261661.1 Transcription factor ILR3 [Hirschfeldia incana]
MVSAEPENASWISDLIDSDYGSFTIQAPAGFSCWPLLHQQQPIIAVSSNSSVGVDGNSEAIKEPASTKRARCESSSATSSKACREKQRRDKLNDKFMELGAILEHGHPPKTDKAAILIDAVRMVKQLRGEAQKLKDSNSSLHGKIKELKTEKNELRDEKQRLKTEKEKLEQQLKAMNAPHQPRFFPAPPPMIPTAFASTQGQAPGNKMVPVISYPGIAMWQFMPPASVDTSQDHVLRPPVA